MYITEYHLVLKINDILVDATTWMNLKVLNLGWRYGSSGRAPVGCSSMRC
jgi:hypothetical protein